MQKFKISDQIDAKSLKKQIKCALLFCHSSNFKGTGEKKSPILTQFECFQKIIHQISRSRGTKIPQIFTRVESFRTVTPVLFIDGFEIMHKA